MNIYPTVRQHEFRVIIELREYNDELAGYIGAMKSYDLIDRGINDANVIFNMTFNYGSITGWSPEEAEHIQRLIGQAIQCCHWLDRHIYRVITERKFFYKRVRGYYVIRKPPKTLQ